MRHVYFLNKDEKRKFIMFYKSSEIEMIKLRHNRKKRFGRKSSRFASADVELFLFPGTFCHRFGDNALDTKIIDSVRTTTKHRC